MGVEAQVNPQMSQVVEPPTLLRAEEVAARAHLYRLLAAVFLEEPGAGFIAALRRPEALAELAGAGVRFDADFLEAGPDALLDALAVEYCSLFLASGGFPPLESVRLTGHLQQQPLFEMRALFRRMGFALGRGRHLLDEDQLGVELLFVAEMLDRVHSALAADERGEARRLDKEIKRFWTCHLGRWVRGYAQLIAHAAAHSYYREMAGLLGRFATEEIQAMRLRIADEDEGQWVVPRREPAIEQDPGEPVCQACRGPGRLADLEI